MSLTRMVVLGFAAVYVLVGVLGFLGDPIVTEAAHDNMGSASGDLLGLFAINALHNTVHLAIGAFLLWGQPSTIEPFLPRGSWGALTWSSACSASSHGYVRPDADRR